MSISESANQVRETGKIQIWLVVSATGYCGTFGSEEPARDIVRLYETYYGGGFVKFVEVDVSEDLAALERS